MSKNIITETRPGASSSDLLWIQVVASKSGGTSHLVRCYFGGVITCDCEGFGWRGQCSHQAQGKLQEAREALAAITVTAEPAREQVNWNSWLASQGVDLVDEGPVPFDSEPAPVPAATSCKAAGARAYADLFGA